jgi:hypothetical protein
VSIADVKATIGEGIEACDEVTTTIATIRDTLNSTQALAVATTHDSSHPAVTRGLSSLREANHETELVLRRVHASTEAAGRYLGTLG